MKKIIFDRPTFHKGANLTIRLGKEWSGYRGPIELIRNSDEGRAGEAIVVNTEKKRFCDLTRDDIKLMHDVHCTDLGFLEDALKGFYGDKFTSESMVTLITFVIDDGVLGTTTTFI